MKLVIPFIIISATLLAVACGGEPEPTPVPPTATAAPTATHTPLPTNTPTPTATPAPTPTATPEPTPTFTPNTIVLPTAGDVENAPVPRPEYADDLELRMDATGLKTTVIRGLTAPEPVERELISAEEYRERLREDLEEDAEDIAIEGRLYARLGIIAPDEDYAALIEGMYADLVLGYFDTEDEIMRIIVDERGFGLNAEATFTHEFTHALQQIHYDIEALSDDLEGNSDAQTALRSLIEGDAQISELLYMLTYFSEEQHERVRAESASGDMSAFMAAPMFMQRMLFFPYAQGYNFAVELYLRNNDFTLIDAAYDNPPASTEQVIHLEKYDEGEAPVDTAAPDPTATLGEGWEVLESEVMGEAFLQSLFWEALGGEEAQKAAAGWGGDSYLLLDTPADGDALASFSAWDTKEDAAEFADGFMAYMEFVTGAERAQAEGEYGETFDLSADGAAARLIVDGNEALIVIAPDPESVEEILLAALESAEE